MRSKKRKRTSKRIRLSREAWGAFWILLLLTVSLFGFSSSTLTKMRVVRVIAAEKLDRERIENILRTYEGVPQTQIRAHAVESAIERNRTVSSSSYFGNLFGSARVNVVYRKQIANVVGFQGYGIDDRGVIFRAKPDPNLHSELALAVEDLAPILCIADPSSGRDLAELAGKVQDLCKKHDLRLYCDEAGRLCFNIDRSLNVVLGSSERLEKKLEILREALSANASFAAENREIILVNPDDPTVVKK